MAHGSFFSFLKKMDPLTAYHAAQGAAMAYGVGALNRSVRLPTRKRKLPPTPRRTPGKKAALTGRGRRVPRKFQVSTRNAGTQTSQTPRIVQIGRAPRRRQYGSRAGHVTSARGGSRVANHFNKIAVNGVVHNIVLSGSNTTQTTTYLGHCTCAELRMISIAAYALVKRISNEAGLLTVDFNNGLATTAGSEFTLSTRANWEPLTGITNTTYTTTGVDDLQTVADFFSDWIRDNGTSDMIFEEMKFFPMQTTAQTAIARAVRLSLKKAKIHYRCESNLKFQNATPPTPTSDGTDNVEAKPLYDFRYEGLGTGTNYNKLQNLVIPLVANSTTGIINKDAGTEEDLIEPPLKGSCPNVKSLRRSTVAPGEIKNDKLVFFKTQSLQSFFNKQLGTAGLRTYQLRGVGRFAFFALEQVLAPVAAYTVTVDWERNIQVGAWISTRKQQYTNQYNLIE